MLISTAAPESVIGARRQAPGARRQAAPVAPFGSMGSPSAKALGLDR